MEVINVGISPGDFNRDSAEVALRKTNNNFVSVRSALGLVKDWFVRPTAVTNGANVAQPLELAALQAKNLSPDILIPVATTVVRRYTLPLMGAGMLTLDIGQENSTTYTVSWRQSTDGGLTWSANVAISRVTHSPSAHFRLNSVAIPAGPAGRIIEVSFAHNRVVFEGDVGFRFIRSVAFYEYDVNNNHDYLVAIGASITEATFRQRDFFKIWKEQFGATPALFNEAVGGADITSTLALIPTILARHPRAATYLIDLFGNDVTSLRPYSTVNQAMLTARIANFTALINVILASGAKVLISRISYRNYTAGQAVNGTSNEENGSKPFNDFIYDALIEKFSPAAYDGNVGFIDPYTWGRQNIHLLNLRLDPAGVHYRGYAGSRFGKMMALAIGGLVKQGRPLILANETAAGGVLGAKQALNINVSPIGFVDQSPNYFTLMGEIDSPENTTWTVMPMTGNVTPYHVNTDGEACALGISNTTLTGLEYMFQEGAVNGLDTPFPDRAKRSGVAIAGTYDFNFTGCVTGKTYTIQILASRADIPSRITLATVAGVNRTIDAANNFTLMEWTGVIPTTGEIAVSVRPDPVSEASLAYISVITIREE